jgi:ATPase subunit of ABC transporter with duplicated ATPase domains
LGRFGIGSELASRLNSLLSGGEKARLALAKLCIDNPDVFVLDEPTNHLDMESVHALAEALSCFSGAVIFVSHDEYFCEKTMTELWHCDGTSVSQLHCNFEDYKERIRSGVL